VPNKRKAKAEALACLRALDVEWRNCDRLWQKAVRGTNLVRPPLDLQIIPDDDLLDAMTLEEILECTKDVSGLIREYLGILETLGRRMQTA
jgi:hypothetical protein